MNTSETIYKDFFYSAVCLNSEVNYRAFTDLTDKKVFRSYRDIADREMLLKILKGEFDLKAETVSKIRKLVDRFGEIERIAKNYMKIASANNIQVISYLDRDYPKNWKVLSGMPKVFYAVGNYDLIARMTFRGSAAVVGSRNPSRYSQYATNKICSDLGNKGITIVSGMACGIDRQAHISSVGTEGGTIAVLAGGVDNVYPPQNKDVYDLIRANGLIVSEMPPGQRPLRQYFPSRNRLIAGLTDCTLIMEAGIVSGTLHTASFAANQGKEVFVLPNSIYYENAMGGLKLLEDGGNVLLSADSVIDSVARSVVYKRMDICGSRELLFKDDFDDSCTQENIEAIRERAKTNPESLNDDNWKSLIEDALTIKPLSIDEICTFTSLPIYRVSKLLTELELNGTLCQEKGKYALTFV